MSVRAGSSAALGRRDTLLIVLLLHQDFQLAELCLEVDDVVLHTLPPRRYLFVLRIVYGIFSLRLQLVVPGSLLLKELFCLCDAFSKRQL